MDVLCPANRTSPVGNTIARPSAGNAFVPPAGAPLASMSAQALPPAGSHAPHNNMQPYLTFSFNTARQFSNDFRGGRQFREVVEARQQHPRVQHPSRVHKPAVQPHRT